jgi:hypothetical protein
MSTSHGGDPKAHVVVISSDEEKKQNRKRGRPLLPDPPGEDDEHLRKRIVAALEEVSAFHLHLFVQLFAALTHLGGEQNRPHSKASSLTNLWGFC